MSIPRPTPRPIKLPINDFPEVNALLNHPTLSGLYLFEPSTKLSDSSGNDIDGTITGATYQGNSLLFSNDDVDLGDNHDLPNVTTKMSVFALAKMSTAGTSISIVNKIDGVATGWDLRKVAPNEVGFIIYSENVLYFAVSADKMVVDTWYTMAGTYSGNSNQSGMKAYIDAVGAEGGASAMVGATTNAAVCTVGAFSGGGTQEWIGNIAFLAIWIGKELNQREIDSMHDFAMSLI